MDDVMGFRLSYFRGGKTNQIVPVTHITTLVIVCDAFVNDILIVLVVKMLTGTEARCFSIVTLAPQSLYD